MGVPLRRQETVLLDSSTHPAQSALDPDSASLLATTVPYYRTLQYYKDQRLKRKAVLNRNGEPMTISTSTPKPEGAKAPHTPQSFKPLLLSAAKPAGTLPLKPRKSAAAAVKRSAPAPKAPSKVILPSAACPVTVSVTHRTSSPLCPSPPTLRPGRPVFPRSRQEPDLYRTAIRTRMAGTVEGRKVLLMGARLAYSIEAATKELERIVADQQERDGDVVMSDATSAAPAAAMPTPHASSLAMPVLTASWVVVKGEDWEMVDCAA
ncbi:hypothetical protein BJ912DRAFT_853637 [Pholiota molesta]|nr:hypothetical protein BJ912DRAFT_853637 [Pholiota molesta]